MREAYTEAKEAKVVTGTIALLNGCASILFDSRATHSFMSSTYAKLCSINTEPLGLDISLATLVGIVVLCKRVVKNCPINIKWRTLPADLVLFKMLRFDVILIMDWLSRHYASIDCRRKEVMFRPPVDNEFKFVEERV